MEPELDPDVHWITAREAAVILSVSRARVSQLTRRDLLPSVRRGSRYYYRPQVQVIANARAARWHGRLGSTETAGADDEEIHERGPHRRAGGGTPPAADSGAETRDGPQALQPS